MDRATIIARIKAKEAAIRKEDYGNFVRHEYFRIDGQTIWNAIQYSLPGPEALVLEEERRLQANSGQSDA
jgi:uncharacterized protein with HEPN domain